MASNLGEHLKKILSAQESLEHKRRWTGEHDLWAHVLLAAVQDYVAGKSEAEAWFLNSSTTTYSPGGYGWICQVLDLVHLGYKIRDYVAKDDKESLVGIINEARNFKAGYRRIHEKRPEGVGCSPLRPEDERTE